MRPIDAHALKSWIDCGHLRRPTELCFSEQDVVRIIDMRPTIDVAPVVHAYWIGLEYDGYADGFPVFDTWQCSACGEEFYSEGEPPAYKFCPNCGAKMDGEAE